MPLTLLRRRLDVELDPAVAFGALHARAQNAFWLDSGVHAASGMSYLGASDDVRRWSSWAEVLSGLSEVGALEGEAGEGGADAETGGADARRDPDFRLGWVGWLAYELGTLDEEQAGRVPHPAHPVAVFLRVDRAVEFDHATGAVTLLALDAPDAESWFAETAAALEAAARAAANAPASAPGTAGRAAAEPRASAPLRTATVRHHYDAYAHLVEECKRVIERGDAYQLCLTNEFGLDYEPGGEPDPLETYRRLRASSPSHHGGYLRAGDTALLSTSPEQFLAVTPDRTVITRPIKGTRPRGAGPVEDALLRAELAASGKERAENLMIVDLMRNDLSRVCAVGSVRVTELLEVESYRQVHQLVSTVEGTLAEDVSAPDAVAACFPAGSMTGAPKRSAMTHLAAFEGAPRGIYSGAFGYLSFDGSIDLAMVIRSIVLTPGRASVGSGGGITALSDAADEVEETRVKAAALLAVLGAEAPQARSRREHGNL
ncbi:anthranilate synthase component I family protein [Herbiconiux sp. CPCC 205763]|uniref:Anthranilate synthase component I family protein n=1 Tax=Herbiconiux aconitum TaxID=2970913 RepID=A0ABT2GVQ4_9MICO|nr:anthranilate synthase component I family protein [Herbiconiux aconitum]MCS5720294.1 anthranilate synthase component I family protein [Herbiconiux aconitum]